MADRSDGGPAFPGRCRDCGCECDGRQDGMSLRDWFAGQALTGVVVGDPSTVGVGDDGDDDDVAIAYAAFAYRVADAMLRERSNG